MYSIKYKSTLGSGALLGKMLLVRIIDIVLKLILGQVRLSKG